MRRKDCPAGLILRFCLSATFALGSTFGHGQSPPERPTAAASNAATLPVSTTLKANDANVIASGPLSFEDGTAPVAGTPYSGIGTTRSATVFVDGNRIVHSETTRFFRDSQGRTRVERMFPATDSTKSSSPIPAMVTINDPVSGERYVLHPQRKTAGTLQSRGVGAVQPPVAPPAPSARVSLPGFGFTGGSSDSESKAVSLGERVIEGIRVVGTQLEHTVPPTIIGNEQPIVVAVEQWFSPELGVVILTTHRSSIGSETIYRLEQIVRAEPDAALFRVPPDYALREATTISAQPEAISSFVCLEATKKP